MVERAEEHWRPPLFKPARSRKDQLLAAARRFFDLQAGSAWIDLTEILPTVTGTLLDVGCGAQPFRPLIGPKTRYIGVDTADAATKFGYEIRDTVYFTGDRWPIETESVDTVLCTETLEHLLDPRVLLLEARRCLRVGGDLILTVPFAARWHFIPYDYWRYTPSSLNSLLRETGFDEVVVYARGNALTVACYKTMALFLPLLLGSDSGAAGTLVARLAGLLSLPLVILLAAIANLSLRSPGGDDCLGYTVLARRHT
jgi:SAM-dependent methyltransferase